MEANGILSEHNLARFHKKYVVSENGCWEWTGRLNADGYGVFVIGHSKTFLAHRVSFEHFNGALGSLKSLHKCDNPKCVNPEHLFSGTQADNIADMVAKRRNRSIPKHGESNPAYVLTDAQVMEIKSKYIPRKVTLKQLSVEYGVSESLLSMILNGKRRAALTEF